MSAAPPLSRAPVSPRRRSGFRRCPTTYARAHEETSAIDRRAAEIDAAQRTERRNRLIARDGDLIVVQAQVAQGWKPTLPEFGKLGQVRIRRTQLKRDTPKSVAARWFKAGEPVAGNVTINIDQVLLAFGYRNAVGSAPIVFVQKF